MKNIGSQTDFLNEAGKDNWFPYKKFFLYRRKWNVSVYDWDIAWDFTHKVRKVGSAKWMLDAVNLNEFKTSNISIQVENADLEWKENGSVWAGYVPMSSLVKIEAGFKDADGIEYGEKIFQGIIPAGGIKNNPLSRTATIQIVGLTNYLDLFNAEDCSTTVTDENAGTGDGSNTDFYTANDGVAEITEVKVDAAVKKEGTDYEVERLNSKVQKAKIIFAVAPAGATTIFISYYHWYQDQKIEYLVKKLLDVASITNRDIEAAILEDQSESTWVQTTDANWGAGILTHVETVGIGPPSSLQLIQSETENWTGLDVGEFPPGWDKYVITGKPNPYESYDGYAKIVKPGAVKYLELKALQSHALPTWSGDWTKVWKYFQEPLADTEWVEFRMNSNFLTYYPNPEELVAYHNDNHKVKWLFCIGGGSVRFYVDSNYVEFPNVWGAADYQVPYPTFKVTRKNSTTVTVDVDQSTEHNKDITCSYDIDYIEFAVMI